MYRGTLILFAVIAVAGDRQAPAQQVTLSTPLRQINEGFFERIGVSWGFNAPGINFTFNNAGLAQPPFGPYDPQAALRTGFFVGQPGGTNAWFNIEAGQGFRRSVVAEMPVITLTNGYPGFFADASVTPFVISYIPVVGGFPPVMTVDPRVPPSSTPLPYGQTWDGAAASHSNPRLAILREKLAEAQQQGNVRQGDVDLGRGPVGRSDGMRSRTVSSPPSSQPAQLSSAVVPAPSVAEARRLQAEQQSAAEQEAAGLIQRARAAEAAGKPQVAKVYYDMAAKRATGLLKQEALERLSALRDR